MRSLVLAILVICPAVIFGDHAHPATKRTASPNISSRQSSSEFTSEYWNSNGQESLRAKLNFKRSVEGKPKNIIFFLADGLTLGTTAAARVYAGGNENYDLAYDKFPAMGFSKTYCVDRQVPDSASTATAYLTGVKTNYGLIGVDSRVTRGNCEDHGNKELHTKQSIAEMALAAGKAAGLVTTSRVTHATPAPLYAHSADRDWENDSVMASDNCDPELNDDIAEQLVFGETGKKFKVVLGGGRSHFRPNTVRDEEGSKGDRTDGKDLIQDWLDLHGKMGQNASYVWKLDDLLNTDVKNTDCLLGLFSDSYVKYDHEAREDPLEPSLSDMTEIAIKMLQKEENGFFLLVEGGRVDNAHHSGYAKTAVDETRAFSEAVALAVRMTNSWDTLIVATADHGHVITYNGYAERSSDVAGIADISNMDNLPYSVLSYANGPGFQNMYGEEYGERKDISKMDIGAFKFRHFGHYELGSESHGGDDVGIYATGPGSHLFTGAYEQNALPYLMAAAAEIGPYADGAAGSVKEMGIVAMGLILVIHLLRNLLL